MERPDPRGKRLKLRLPKFPSMAGDSQSHLIMCWGQAVDTARLLSPKPSVVLAPSPTWPGLPGEGWIAHRAQVSVMGWMASVAVSPSVTWRWSFSICPPYVMTGFLPSRLPCQEYGGSTDEVVGRMKGPRKALEEHPMQSKYSLNTSYHSGAASILLFDVV